MNMLAKLNEESNIMIKPSGKLESSIIETKDVQPLSGSHLPSWVLKMRLKIADSKLQHNVVQSAISNLHQKSFELDKELSKLSKDAIASKSNKESQLDTNYPNIFSNKKLYQNVDHVNREKIIKKCYIYNLPSDVFSCILEYLQLFHLIRLNGLSKSLQTQIDSSLYWIKALPIYCPHLKVSKDIKNKSIITKAHTTNPNNMYDLKAHFDAYIKSISLCLTFIRTMKDQRCIQRHREIQPHRHRKQEKEVTHPLPLFGRRGNTITPAANLSITSSLQQQQYDLIMSHAETLSSDYRSIAHRSLSVMLIETSFIDNPLNIILVSEGIITVLTSLLSNEEGVLQNYACGIIANLLCWESRHTHLFDKYIMKYNEKLCFDNNNNSDLVCIQKVKSIMRTIGVLFNVNDITSRSNNNNNTTSAVPFLSTLIPLSRQLTACRADRHLATLLTSPTASISLVAGSKDIRRTANVQGICNKQACRALISLFFPAMAIPSIETITHSKSYTHNIIIDHNNSSCCNNSSNSNNTGCEQHQQYVPPLPPPPHSLSVSSIFTTTHTDEVSKPWIFTYFHKSGSFKDQFITYLRFLPDSNTTMQGRGIDSIGVFSLKGNAILDIIGGWTWYLQKSYVRSNSIEMLGLSVVEWIQFSGVYDITTYNDLLDGSSSSMLKATTVTATNATHVSHVAYWSSGISTAITSDCTYSNYSEEANHQQRNLNLIHKDIVNIIPTINLEYYHEESSNGTGLWGLGLYGVWETSSDNTPHFDLQKGGVFTAIPIITF